MWSARDSDDTVSNGVSCIRRAGAAAFVSDVVFDSRQALGQPVTGYS
jgi:hypothetical protein